MPHESVAFRATVDMMMTAVFNTAKQAIGSNMIRLNFLKLLFKAFFPNKRVP